MSVRVAATLRLAERAGSTGATVEQLASETGTPAPALRCLLDHLVAVGGPRPRRAVRPLSPHESRRPDARGRPEGIKPLLDIHSAGGRADLAFVEPPSTITTGSAAYADRYGHDF